MERRQADTGPWAIGGTKTHSVRSRAASFTALTLLGLLLVGVATARASAPQLRVSGSLVEWGSLGSEWGYKVAVSNHERCAEPDPECVPAREKEYVEIQRSSSDPQSFIAYAQNLQFSPSNGEVWVGVGELPTPGTNPPSYSSEVRVRVVGTKIAGADRAPTHLLSEGDTVRWEATGQREWGYKVAVSDGPRCESGGCRLTDSFLVPKTGEGPQSYSPCLERLNFVPRGDTVFVGVATLPVSASTPNSYTASEVSVTVPKCPSTTPATNPQNPQNGGGENGSSPAPVNSQAPSVTGTAAVGYLLTAGLGTWQHQPSSYGLQWQICDASGSACQDVSGATGTTFPLTSGDFGHRMRVVVTAANTAGTAAAVSAPSPVVGAKVEATVEWSFAWGPSFTIVESLNFHGITAGVHLEVTCRGSGCPFKTAGVTPQVRHSPCHSHHCAPTGGSATVEEAKIGSLFKRRHLRPGAVITVRLTKPGWVGRIHVFTIRAGQRPSHRPACLAPGSTQPSSC
jgi:hypothetical protein